MCINVDVPMIVIAVIGSKRSGKTTTIEVLVRGLTKQGYRVATIKHVSKPNFTIDCEGKDTWRHAQAGAQTTVVVAPKELGIIKKTNTMRLSLQKILKNCQNNVDIIILEGFRSLVGKKTTVPKIVSIKTLEEAMEASNRFKPVIAFTGSKASIAKELGIPVINVLKEPEKLVEIVLSEI